MQVRDAVVQAFRSLDMASMAAKAASIAAVLDPVPNTRTRTLQVELALCTISVLCADLLLR